MYHLLKANATMRAAAAQMVAITPALIALAMSLPPIIAVVLHRPLIGRPSLDGMMLPFANSTALAAGSCLIAIPTAFVIAAKLPFALRPFHMAALAACLTPLLVGDAVAAFSLKMTVSALRISLPDTPVRTFACAIAVQLWQSIPLCTLAYSARLGAADLSGTTDVATVARVSWLEYVRFVGWPTCRGLTTVLLLFVFLRGFHEYIKLCLAMGIGGGTAMRPIGHWLLEDFKIFTKSPRLDGLRRSTALAILISIAAVLSAAVFSFVSRAALGESLKAISKLPIGGRWTQTQASLAVTLLATVCFFPFCGVLLRCSPNGMSIIRHAMWGLAPAAALGLVSTAFAVYAAALLRLSGRGETSPHGFSSTLMYTLLLIPSAAPGVIVGIVTFWWAVVCGGGSPLVACTVWATSQFALATPFLLLFILAVLSRVSDGPRELLHAYQTPLNTLGWYTYVRPVLGDLELVAMFGITSIWFEGVASSFLSNRGFSSAGEAMLSYASARNADFGACSSLAAFAVATVALSTTKLGYRSISRCEVRR